MSDSSQLEDDHFENRSAAPSPATDSEDRDARSYMAHLANTLGAHGAGVVSYELALDLVLNEIVEQARLASTATAAAIALVAGDELVCRATTGANAPGLGIRLPMHSGLIAACVESLEPQRCDDSEVDSRVDAAAYRNLEIRSILIVPVLSDAQLLGVFEIFSPRPNEFGDREVQTLQALSRRIVNNVRYAAESKAESSAIEEPGKDVRERVKIVPKSPLPTFSKLVKEAQRGTDYWTSALTGLVIAMALLLGWMAGRGGDSGSADSVDSSRPLVAKAPAASDATSRPAAPLTSGTPATSSPKKNASDAYAEGISSAGLVVYDKGKIIYRAAPPRKGDSSGKGSSGSLVTLPAATVSSLLLERVEPEYPEAARNAGVEGNVSMRVTVNKEGTIQEIQVDDGSPQLVPAAVDAVRRWRFKPYESNGTVEEFQAQIVVAFKLPQARE